MAKMAVQMGGTLFALWYSESILPQRLLLYANRRTVGKKQVNNGFKITRCAETLSCKRYSENSRVSGVKVIHLQKADIFFVQKILI